MNGRNPAELIGDIWQYIIALLAIYFILRIIIWLIIRELMCWYWKVNERIHLLREIRNELRVLNQNMEKWSRK